MVEASKAATAGIGVVARSAALLRALADTTSGMSLGQIAKQIGLPRSTVQRLVSALEAEGFIRSGVGAGQITLGPEFLRIAGHARGAILDRIRPIMVHLSGQLEETVDFSSIQRDCIVFLEQVTGRQRLAAVSHVGDSFPLHCTSVGKAYLATRSRGDIEATIGDHYEKFTEHTLGTLDDLMPQLEMAKRDGYAFDLEEHTLGIRAIGLAFADQMGNWYGLSVPMPATRFAQKRDRALELLEAARHDMRSSI